MIKLLSFELRYFDYIAVPGVNTSTTERLTIPFENFGSNDGFVDIGSGRVFILKPGVNKDDFTSNSYDIIDLKSLYL